MKIPSPCTADWDAMRPEDAGKSRHCELCATRVHDLSAMTEREARVFLATTASQQVCLSYLETSDGRRLFADTPRTTAPRHAVSDVVPPSRLTVAARRPGVPAPLVKSALVGALAACTPHGEVAPLVIDDTESEMRALRTAGLEPGPTIPDAAKTVSPDREPAETTPCDPAAKEPGQARGHTDARPPKAHRTAGIPIRTTGDMLANDPLGGL